MRKQLASAHKVKKAVTSLMVLLIFLLPAVLGLQWIYSVMGGRDSRKVYSPPQQAEFNKGNPSSADALRPFDEPLITITFDDGWESAYTEGMPILEKYGIKPTHYILGDQFDDPQYLSEAQARSLQAAGHEIAAHTMTHRDLTTLTEDQVEWEQSESDKRLTSIFGPIREFATPLGASNDLVLRHTKPYYRSMRNTAGDPATMSDIDINVRENFDQYNINAYTVRDTTTTEDIQKMIDYTVRRKGWLVLTYHQVGDQESHWAVSKQVLDTHMKLIKDSKVRTATMGQVLDATGLAKEQKGGY